MVSVSRDLMKSGDIMTHCSNDIVYTLIPTPDTVSIVTADGRIIVVCTVVGNKVYVIELEINSQVLVNSRPV